MAVVIGIDPHKQSHQAVAIDDVESELSRLEVRATKTQGQMGATTNQRLRLDIHDGRLFG